MCVVISNIPVDNYNMLTHIGQYEKAGNRNP
jgi:hypothetical protein